MNPREIEEMSWRMAEVYEAVVNRILINMARHFQYINAGEVPSGTWIYQAKKLAEMGQVNKETEKIILDMLGDADGVLRALLEKSILNGLKDAEPALRKAAENGFLPWGINTPPVLEPGQMQAFSAYYKQSADKLNLVNTVMLESTGWAYQSTVADIVNRMNNAQGILNKATGEVVTGVSSWNDAIRRGVQDMVKNGITGFVDHGGHKWSPEAYVAMDVRTTMANTARAAVWERCEAYGDDLYQVSWHNGARELCFPWQGKVISRSDTVRDVEDDEGNTVHVYAQSETTYGEPAGLFGINCGHYPIPFVPGFSRIRQPQQDAEENEKAYRESQKQRYLERKLREEKRDLEVMKAQGASAEELKEQRKRIRAASENIDTFCDETGLTRRRNRETAPVRATWPTKNGPVTRYDGGYISADVTPPPKGTFTERKKQETEQSSTLHDSLADAYEYHRTANGLTSAPYDASAPLQFIKEDLSNLGPRSASVVEQTISGLTKKYDTPLVSVRTMDKTEALFNKNAFAACTHNYSTDTAEIRINPVKCKDGDKLTARVQELIKNGYSAPIPGEYADRYVYAHEFGHSLLSMESLPGKSMNFVGVDTKRLKGIQNEVKAIYAEYAAEVGNLEKAKRAAEMRVILEADEAAAVEARELIKKLDSVQISRYSLTNANEFFAESFVYTEYGGTGKEYADRIRAIVDKYFLR